ncbi:iron hydrogenase small subunit [Selenomonas sp.]|uniref:iron hydrogenase small subunit n=1 Tax=Selenomonas sp. TaxID=2053611 RepID=UPI003A0FD9E1
MACALRTMRLASSWRNTSVRQTLGTTRAITKERIASLYAIDRSLPHRKSHENPVIQKLYERDLGAPLSPKAHDLLHTTYHEIPPACTF